MVPINFQRSILEALTSSYAIFRHFSLLRLQLHFYLHTTHGNAYTHVIFRCILNYIADFCTGAVNDVRVESLL